MRWPQAAVLLAMTEKNPPGMVGHGIEKKMSSPEAALDLRIKNVSYNSP